MSTSPGHAELMERLRSLGPRELAALRQRSGTPAATGAAWVAEALLRAGIREVLTIPGVPIDPVLAECISRGIRVLGFRHQQAAVLAAAAANYTAGTLRSAVVVSSGPAVANTLTGIQVACANGWPVLVLGGRRAISDDGLGAFQSLDALPILGPFTVHAACLRQRARVMEEILGAAAATVAGRPGPAYVDLPEDVLSASVSCTEYVPSATRPREEPDPGLIAEVAERIRTARRPLLILGDGLRWSLATEVLRSLVDLYGIPFISTSLARGYLPDDHPRCAGEVRQWVQGEADLVLVAGARLDWRFRFGAGLKPDAFVVHAEEGADAFVGARRSDRTNSGDPNQFLRALVAALDASPAAPAMGAREPWNARIADAREEQRRVREGWALKSGHPMSPQQFCGALQDSLPSDAFLVMEGNVVLSTAHRILSLRQPVSWLDPGANGIIGAALPFALGVRIADSRRPIVAVCSDTGFGISGLELETAVRNRFPLVVIVVNNGGNTGDLRERAMFPGDHPDPVALIHSAVRYDHLAESLGAEADRVSEAVQLGPALQRALGSGRTVCIEVRVDPSEPHPGSW